jgi:mannosyl-3-phosphoglycerate phosphatase
MTLLIFTDLDGTLLDHHTYSYAPALAALAEIKQRGYPLILCSSKTRAELVALHRELELTAPFICENGAAVYWQETSTQNPNENSLWQCQAFSTERDTLITRIHELRARHQYRFTGFNDCTTEQIAELTGLDKQQAKLAATREFTEPLLWQDSDERLEQFRSQLAEQGLRAVQGGRFLSVMGQFDKSSAMQWLVTRYRTQQPSESLILVALGDSPNDEAMLQAADIAVVIQSPRSAALHVNQPKQVIRTTAAGPVGWQEAMETILASTATLTGNQFK